MREREREENQGKGEREIPRKSAISALNVD
jgi:hypothetical protein